MLIGIKGLCPKDDRLNLSIGVPEQVTNMYTLICDPPRVRTH
jgi:hypothetical protein